MVRICILAGIIGFLTAGYATYSVFETIFTFFSGGFGALIIAGIVTALLFSTIWGVIGAITVVVTLILIFVGDSITRRLQRFKWW